MSVEKDFPTKTVDKDKLDSIERLAEHEDSRIAELATTARDNLERMRQNGRLEVIDE
jgi:hypothetical protein